MPTEKLSAFVICLQRSIFLIRRSDLWSPAASGTSSPTILVFLFNKRFWKGLVSRYFLITSQPTYLRSTSGTVTLPSEF